VSLDRIESMPTPQARETLRQIQGVGEKVANCILLFAYGRREAFPIDVWVDRVLRQLYFKGSSRVSHERLRDFAESHFGPCRGYAQQFLFHWIRKDPKALPPGKPESAKKKRVKRVPKVAETG
jgi:N-glycosylase/DNA lyase